MDVAPIYQEVDTIGMFHMEVCFNETYSASHQKGCQIFPLTSRDIDDNMFDLSRIFLMLATLFGSFFTLFLITAVFWESINLKPIGLGLLAIYFLQSFSMLFFLFLVVLFSWSSLLFLHVFLVRVDDDDKSLSSVDDDAIVDVVISDTIDCNLIPIC